MNSRNAAWTLTTLHECVKKNYECSSWCRSYITFQYFCHGYVKKYDGKQIRTTYLSTLCYLHITNSWFIFFVQYISVCVLLFWILFLVYCLKNSLWPPTNICAILSSIFGTLLKSWLWSTYYLWYFEFYFWYIVWTVDCGLLTLRYWLNLHVIFYSFLQVIYTKSSPTWIFWCYTWNNPL